MTTTATRSATTADRDRSARVGLFTGRGDTSTPIGLLFAHPDAPPPTPATVATLPIGRRLLTANTERDYRAALAAFADAWRAGGFGDTACEHTDPPPDLGTCPPANGRNTDRWAGTAYTFDEGRVFYYIPHRADRLPHRGQWHTITLADAPRGSAVELTPATREYGESHPDTAALDLPEVAVWLMAELTALGRSDASAVWPYVRYAAAVNTALAEIRLYLYGLDDTPATRRLREEADHDAFDEISSRAVAHGWTNPRDAWDRRFQLFPHVVSEHDGPDLRARGRGPGTVTVVDDPAPFWS